MGRQDTGTSQLRIVRATGVEELAGHLVGQLLADPPADPLAGIEVTVPGRGIQRWLVQRLAEDLGRDGAEAGVCANVTFPFLGSVLERSIRAVLGEPEGARDPWKPDRLVWPLLELLDDLPADPELAPLRTHLTEEGQPALARRFPLARRIADLFDRYSLYRPELVRAWTQAAGTQAAGTQAAGTQGAWTGPGGRELPAGVRWQPWLWRELVRRLDAPDPERRLTAALTALDEGALVRPEELPAAITVFGIYGLPPRHLDLLVALGEHRAVTLYLLTGCPHWAPDRPAPAPANALLAASGRSAADAHTVVASRLGERVPAVAVPDHAEAAGSMLSVLQADLLADRRRGEGGQAPRHRLDPDDRSVQIHAAHGPMRQLEVLREVLLGLLEDDPTLEPRDIVLLFADVPTYAPLLAAAFPSGGAAGDGPPALPVRVADRSLRERTGVGQVLLNVLELATGRVTASQLLDLLASPPVRARFGLTDPQLAQLPAWLQGTGTRWGLDAEHRRDVMGLHDGAHTLQAGLDRLVLGAAMADDGRLVGEVLPFDDVEGTGLTLVGQLSDAVASLTTCLRSLHAPRPIAEWVAALDAVLTVLVDPGAGARATPELTAQLAAVRTVLEEVVVDSPVALTLEELRGLLAAAFEQRAVVSAFGTGAITATSLVPLRNVPHRVVCLVGMDDGVLPRSSLRPGFDLMAADQRPGDPDPRLEDRQLVLDAVRAAGEHLVITTTGHDPRTNEPRQPAVVVTELLDLLERSVVVGGDEEAGAVRRRLVTTHPLQRHSPRYFAATRDGPEPLPRAFDRDDHAAARATTDPRHPPPVFLPGPLPPPPPELIDPEVVDLDELVRGLEHPVRFLLQKRLGLVLGEDDRRIDDRDPVELDALERWRLTHHLLEQRLHRGEHDTAGWRRRTLATGTTPVGGLGEASLDGIEETVEALVAAAAQVPDPPRTVAIDVRVPLPEDAPAPATRRVLGAVELRGSTLLHVGASKLKAKHRLAAWVRLLAVLAGGGAPTTVARLITPGAGAGAAPRQVVLDPSSLTGDGDADLAPAARTELGWLVGCWLRATVEPVALLPETAHAYAIRRAKGEADPARALRAVRGTWEGSDQVPGEQGDAYVVQAFGADVDLAELEHRHPFTALAERLFCPILDAEGGA